MILKIDPVKKHVYIDEPIKIDALETFIFEVDGNNESDWVIVPMEPGFHRIHLS